MLSSRCRRGFRSQVLVASVASLILLFYLPAAQPQDAAGPSLRAFIPSPTARVASVHPAGLRSDKHRGSIDRVAPVLSREPPSLFHSAADWERFEAEFGVPAHPASPIQDSLQQALYHVDTMIFVADGIAQGADLLMQWELGSGSWQQAPNREDRPAGQRNRGPPGLFDGARVKLDLRWAGPRSYVGVRVVLLFGD